MDVRHETRDVIGDLQTRDQEAVRRSTSHVSRLGSSRVYRLTSPALILTARLESAPYRTMMNVPAALELESARRPFFTVSAKFAE